jgi:peptide/nickel transport system ATP-binding protein
VPGSVADNIPWEGGCAFAPRCSSEVDTCRRSTPDLVRDAAVTDDRLLRCHNPLASEPEAAEEASDE